jgi:hypothetical protein
MLRAHEYAKEHTAHQGVMDQIHTGNVRLTWNFLWKTPSVENYDSDSPISQMPGWNLDRTPRLPHQVLRALYTSGCSCEFRLLLHIVSTQQTLNKMHGCKFNIKVITDYLLTLLSLTWTPQLSRNVAADGFGLDIQEFLYKYPDLKMRVDPTIISFLLFFPRYMGISYFVLLTQLFQLI